MKKTSGFYRDLCQIKNSPKLAKEFRQTVKGRHARHSFRRFSKSIVTEELKYLFEYSDPVYSNSPLTEQNPKKNKINKLKRRNRSAAKIYNAALKHGLEAAFEVYESLQNQLAEYSQGLEYNRYHEREKNHDMYVSYRSAIYDLICFLCQSQETKAKYLSRLVGF